MLCSSVYHTLMMKRGIKLIIIRGFLMISNHLKLEGTRVSLLNHIWSHTKFIPNETFLKKKKYCTSYIQDSEKLNISIYQPYYEWLCECT